MTLIIAAKGKNFVVVGADSIGMVGDLKGPVVVGSTRSRKIVFLAKHVGTAIYGVAEFGQNILHQFQSRRRRISDGVTNVVEALRTFCREKWNEWFRQLDPRARPPLGFMVVGLDKDQKVENIIYREHIA